MNNFRLSLLALITHILYSLVMCAGLCLLGSWPRRSMAVAEVHGGTERWDHVVDLNENFRIMWTIVNQDITFEIQARTLGYVGFGFSPDGRPANADMAVGWVDKGHTYFQDRYVRRSGDLEPVVDPSQDYVLMMGFENATHTVLRFRRKLDTCDSVNDIAITNNTMRVMYMYNDQDPPHGDVSVGSLPDPSGAWRSYRPLVLMQKGQPRIQHHEHTRILELRNREVQLPFGDDTLYWCKMFKLQENPKKQHLIHYEPIYDSSWSIQFLQHITLYECQGEDDELEEMAREQGRQCLGVRSMSLACNAIVTSWVRGSEGFTFPAEAGYPFESQHAKYYLMETHYSNMNPEFDQIQARPMVDNSGLKLHFTQVLRPHDAGVISIGMDPNWRHIIPPGQKHVVSEGQCVEECTRYAFPFRGIEIFAVMMRTHEIGREVKLRQIRQSEELPPIAHDNNIDRDYQNFRHLPKTVHSLPGDRLVVECIYDSSSRKAITLGGLTMKEESCTVLTLYYPRQKKLTTCHSLPSLPTVLHSLGIEQLATNSYPVVIAAPPELTGMTLETRLLSYDWENHFGQFQQATIRGSFKPFCWNANNKLIPNSEYLEAYSINLTKSHVSPRRCKPKRLFVTETAPERELPVFHDLQTNHIIEGSAQRSSRSSAIETLALSSAVGVNDGWRSFWVHLEPWWACLLATLMLLS